MRRVLWHISAISVGVVMLCMTWDFRSGLSHEQIVQSEATLFFPVELAEVLIASQEKETVLVDVRSAEIYTAGHIPGAVNIPLDASNREELIHEIGGQRSWLVYGNRSDPAVEAFAAELAKRWNWSVSVYSGGWGQWKACGLATEDAKP